MSNQCAKKYASLQGAEYDPETNTILYGISTNMRAIGVNSGNGVVINPLMYTERQKCGLGSADGNPYRENFTSNGHDDNNYYYVIIAIIILIIIIK